MPDACPEVRPGRDRVPLEYRDRFPAHQLLSDELRDARLGQPLGGGASEVVERIGRPSRAIAFHEEYGET